MEPVGEHAPVAGLPLEHVLEAEQDDLAMRRDGPGEQIEHAVLHRTLT
jgi:hypothetical protein